MAELEAEVFLSGIWKNYDELENVLSMPELLLTLEASRKIEYSRQKFAAAIKGIDLDAESSESSESKGFEDIERRAHIRLMGGDPDANDVADLRGGPDTADKFGIAIGDGLSYGVE